MDLTVLTYVIYLAVSVVLTLWVAHVLVKAGKVFLDAVFPGEEALAKAVNQLLVVGFYLVNLGFIALWLRRTGSVADARGIFEALSVDVGTVLLVLGAMHLGNVFVLNRLRRRAIDGPRQPRPERQLAPPADGPRQPLPYPQAPYPQG